MSDPIYSEILSRRYPGLQFRMEENNYASIVGIGGAVIPSQATLDALWPSVESELIILTQAQIRALNFQLSYPVQDQLIEIMKAITTDNQVKLLEMLNLWEVL